MGTPRTSESVLLRNAQLVAEKWLSRQVSPFYSTTALQRTSEVVAAVHQLAKPVGLRDSEIETILLAAWLHHTGAGQPNAVEESIRIATEFLLEQELEEVQVGGVLQGIRVLHLLQPPQNLPEQVLLDASRLFLSDRYYLEKAVLENRHVIEAQWLADSIRQFREHHYLTPYANQVFLAQKEENLEKLKKRLKKLQKPAEESGSEEDVTNGKKKENQYGRGIETMFRSTLANHYQLSAVADNKANMMISINSIIISIIISLLIQKLERFPNLVLPTLLLILVCLLTIVFAILATRPNIVSDKIDREEISHSPARLLFFGSFYRMKREDYKWGMRNIMKAEDLLYDSMIYNLYDLGKVLAKKYHYLKISYTIFMVGLVVSVIAFSVAMVFFG